MVGYLVPHVYLLYAFVSIGAPQPLLTYTGEHEKTRQCHDMATFWSEDSDAISFCC